MEDCYTYKSCCGNTSFLQDNHTSLASNHHCSSNQLKGGWTSLTAKKAQVKQGQYYFISRAVNILEIILLFLFHTLSPQHQAKETQAKEHQAEETQIFRCICAQIENLNHGLQTKREK